jgi:hypothetical protein
MRPILAVLLVAFACTPLAQAKPRATPDSSYAPEDVVRIVLRGLAKPDDPTPNAGIETSFRFASPDNRAKTGPLPKFIKLVQNPIYAPLLGHQRALRGEIEVSGDAARERVRVIAKDGSQAAYIFLLKRQPEGSDCSRCWMTEAVVRVEKEGGAT